MKNPDEDSFSSGFLCVISIINNLVDLSEVFDKELSIATLTKFHYALLSDLAYALTSKTELITNLFQSLLVATNAETLTDDGDFAVLEYVAEYCFQLLRHTFVIHLLVSAAVLTRCKYVCHAVVVVFLKRRIDAHVMIVGLDRLVDLGLVDVDEARKLLYRWLPLVLLLEL